MSRPESVFVQDRQLRLQHGQLEDLVALLLATGEAFVDATVQQFVLQVQHGQLLPHQLEELHGIELFLAACFALCIQRGAQEVGVVHAGDFHRVLERQEQAGSGARFRVLVEQVDAFELHAAFGDLIAVAAGQDIAQGGLAGAVGAHDGVHLAGLHVQDRPLRISLSPMRAWRFSIFSMVGVSVVRAGARR